MKASGKKIGVIILILLIIFLAAGLWVMKDRAETAEEQYQSLVESQDVSDDIVILYTNDAHCGINGDIGYSGLSAYKAYMEEQTEHVTLVDCGDAIQGEYIGMISQGEYVIDIMNQVGYDYAILGNHEFDYGGEQMGVLMDKAEFQYLGCNIAYTGTGEDPFENLLPYEIVEYGDTSVGFIGVTTPYTTGLSSISNFTEGDRYIFDFALDDTGETLYNCVQTYVYQCRDAGADYVVLLTHLGDGEVYSPFSVEDLVAATEGVDVVLDGHAHNEISCMIEENINGDEVLISSTGTKMENIGQLVITEDGTVTTGLVSHYEKKDAGIDSFVAQIQSSYESDLQVVVGQSKATLATRSEKDEYLVRTRETGIGNLIADAHRFVLGAQIGMMNGGGIRADIEAGPITYEDIFSILPFGNEICLIEVSGQEVLDILELTYRLVESDPANGADGGFQHLSGLKAVIDTSIPTSVVVDQNAMFVSVEGERRVQDVQVLNKDGEYEPIDPEETYTMAVSDYMIFENGSGVNFLSDNVMLEENGIADYQVLTEYITEELGGVIDERYAEPEGRITVK